ncbi:MAG: energy transducer TonB [Rhodothermaceae bacterium]
MRKIRLPKLIKLVIFSSVLILSTTIFASLPQAKYLAFAEVMPKPIGGIEAVYKNITSYPRAAKDAGIEGKVYVLAFINEKGTVDKVKVVKGLGGGCDEAAIKAVRKTKFTPAKSKGKAVKVKTSLAIVFKIQK